LESHLQPDSTTREHLGSTRASRVLFGALAEELVSFCGKPVVIMKTTRSSILVAEVPGYAELQREMHDALRAQHPEWIEADGKSPTCDYYESLFAVLLVSHRAHARAHYDHLLNITKTERLSVTANFSMPVGHAEARNIVFPEMALAIG
jgi:hypothetical protein